MAAKEDKKKKKQTISDVAKNIKAKKEGKLIKKAETAAPASTKELSNQDKTAAILLAALPTIGGLILGGTEGGAIGAQAGQKGAQTFFDIKGEERKRLEEAEQAKKSRAEKLADVASQRAFQSGESQKAREFRGKEGAAGRELQRESIKSRESQAQQTLAQRRSESKASQEISREKLALDEKKVAAQLEAQRAKIAEKPVPKANERQAATFAARVVQAESAFFQLTSSGVDTTTAGFAAKRLLPEIIKPEEVKLQEQAERNFVNAILRRESGAAIAESEFDSAERQYFPRAGDSAAVLRQKAQNRAIALEGLKQEAGTAFEDIAEGVNLQATVSQDLERSGGSLLKPEAQAAGVSLEAKIRRRDELLKKQAGGR